MSELEPFAPIHKENWIAQLLATTEDSNAPTEPKDDDKGIDPTIVITCNVPTI